MLPHVVHRTDRHARIARRINYRGILPRREHGRIHNREAESQAEQLLEILAPAELLDREDECVERGDVCHQRPAGTIRFPVEIQTPLTQPMRGWFGGAHGGFDPPVLPHLRAEDDFDGVWIGIGRQLRLGLARRGAAAGLCRRLIMLLVVASLADCSLRPDRITIRAELDDHAAAVTKRRFVVRRVLQLFEIVFVCAIPDIHLGLERRAALLAILPMPLVPLAGMKAAQRETPMVARATASRVGEQHVFMLVVANPLPAALGFGEILRFAAQAASGLRRFVPCFHGLFMTAKPAGSRHAARTRWSISPRITLS